MRGKVSAWLAAKLEHFSEWPSPRQAVGREPQGASGGITEPDTMMGCALATKEGSAMGVILAWEVAVSSAVQDLEGTVPLACSAASSGNPPN